MFLEKSAQEARLRAELRAYDATVLTDEVRAGLTGDGAGGARWREVVQRIGADGWLGIGWPEEYGGQGRPATDQFIFFDETRRAGAPFPFVTVNTVGPTLMSFGSDEQKRISLPPILAGELNFAIGYTEPGAGTDLAALATTAVRDGDHCMVNGAKVFTSGTGMADYIWLAVRTDPAAPKHKEISILCVPTSAPGFESTLITTVGGLTTAITRYGDVRVPGANLVGAENQGWKMITTPLNHERVGLAAWSGLAHELFDEVAVWAAAQPGAGGGRLIDEPWVKADLARAEAELEAMRLLNRRMATAVSAGNLGAAESSSIKVFVTERTIQVYRLLLGIVGPGGHLTSCSPGAVLHGRLEGAARQAQINTVRGWVKEIQREIVATVGRGMHRGER